MTAIVNYGVGNLHSIKTALGYLGFEHEITSDARKILSAQKVILPGVGAFGDAMRKLRESGLEEAVKQAAADGAPLLGVCVGMQMLFEGSVEFGMHGGLGLLPGRVYSMQEDISFLGLDLKVPQIGWNSLKIARKKCAILKYSEDDEFFYYVHSFYAKDCPEVTAAFSNYGVTVPGVVCRDNVYGCQFHPEKSGGAGLRILRAFCEL